MNRKIFKVFLSLLLSISLIIGNSVSFADTTDDNPADPYFNFTDYDDTDEDEYYFYYDDNASYRVNIGLSIAITRKPTTTAITTMIAGSRMVIICSVASCTSSS